MRIQSLIGALTAGGGTTQTITPSAIFPGFILTNRVRMQAIPNASIGPSPTNPNPDPNTYSLYRQQGSNPPVRVNSGIVPALSGTGIATKIKFIYGGDALVPPLPATTYTYWWTAVDPGGNESLPSPSITVTTLAGSATPPTTPAPVADPATWIVPYALPNPALGTTWLCTNHTVSDVIGTGTPGPGNTVTGCSFLHALNNAAIGGGDTIVLDAGATYPVPFPHGYQPPAFTGTNGWTYVISSEDPVYKSGGKLPPFVDASAGPNYNFPLTLTAAPVIGATTATLTTNWPNKTGIYPVQFYNSIATSNQNEQRYVTFTKGFATISWNNGYNPNAIDGTLGASLVANCTTTISVVYLPGVTNYDVDNGALPIINFGGPGTEGYGFQNNSTLKNVRFVGICIQPVGTNPTDNAHFVNFNCFFFHGNDDHVYLDRCVFGGDSTKFTTSGFGAGGSAPTVTSTTYGFVGAGVGRIQGNHILVHQCYFRGCARTPDGVAQDSQAIYQLGGGPVAIQYNHIESVSEGYIAGGGFVPQNNIPNNLTYRYNFNTKPQWWASAFQTLTLESTTTPQNFTGNGTVGPYTISAGATESFRFGVTINGALQAPSAYTINPAGTAITFASPVATGAAGVVLGTGKIIFGDYVKNLFELKVMLGANVYGNVHWNCWFSDVSGYLGSSFAPGCREQISSNDAYNPATGKGTTVFSTCPWSGQIYDLDIHDNISIGVGQGFNPFGGGVDYGPASSTGRMRVRNNITHVQNPWICGLMVLYRGRVYDVQVQGQDPDFIFDHNTFVTDPTNNIVPASTRGFSFVPGVFDRFTITNNIITGATAIGGTTLTGTAFQNPAGAGWNGNLTIQDATGPYPTGSTTYQAVPYASVGFKKFVSNFQPPAQPSDWNVVSGTHIGTDGVPVGAMFPSLQFPLVGAVLVAPEDYSTVANIGKPGALVLENFPGFSFGGKNITQQVTAIKALNPTGKVFTYVDIMEIDSVNSGAGTTYHTAWTAISANNWFLRSTFPAGAIVQSQAAQNSVNIVQSRLSASNDPVRPNATYRQWYATFAASYFPQNADGIFTDNFQLWPKQDGDYAESGSSQSRFNATTTQNWRNAYADWVTQAKAVAGGPGLVIGNIGDWGQGGGNTPVTPLTGYPGILDGGAYEGAMGAGFSLENTSWVSMMNNYAVIMQNMKTVNYVFFMHDHSPVTGYAAMRYGLCSCLLDNGYYYFNLGGSLNSVSWFDEFDFVLGSAIAGPNNPTNGTYSSGGLTVWQKGVWRRDFANGIILVNPRGNHPDGAGTGAIVTLETTYWHLRGTQDPTTNNAAAVTSVTLPDPNVAGTGGSGLFLSRTPT